MPLEEPSAGSWTSTSLNGFSLAKGINPFSPTAACVMTLSASPVTVEVAATLSLNFVPFVMLAMVSPAGMPVPDTASNLRRPDVPGDTLVTVFEPLVMFPVTFVTTSWDRVEPASPLRPGQP